MFSFARLPCWEKHRCRAFGRLTDDAGNPPHPRRADPDPASRVRRRDRRAPPRRPPDRLRQQGHHRGDHQRRLLGRPRHRALWIPAGTVHQHQAHGELDLHLVGLPTTENPLGLDKPAVLAVSPLLRELIVAPIPATPITTARPACACAPSCSTSSPSPPSSRCTMPTPTDPLLRELHDVLRADPADNRSLDDLGRRIGASARTLPAASAPTSASPTPNGAPRSGSTTPWILLADRLPPSPPSPTDAAGHPPAPSSTSSTEPSATPRHTPHHLTPVTTAKAVRPPQVRYSGPIVD